MPVSAMAWPAHLPTRAPGHLHSVALHTLGGRLGGRGTGATYRVLRLSEALIDVHPVGLLSSFSSVFCPEAFVLYEQKEEGREGRKAEHWGSLSPAGVSRTWGTCGSVSPLMCIVVSLTSEARASVCCRPVSSVAIVLGNCMLTASVSCSLWLPRAVRAC